jgi:RTX calcium-binding nonapeptide repeat (4 copies)
LQQE